MSRADHNIALARGTGYHFARCFEQGTDRPDCGILQDQNTIPTRADIQAHKVSNILSRADIRDKELRRIPVIHEFQLRHGIDLPDFGGVSAGQHACPANYFAQDANFRRIGFALPHDSNPYPSPRVPPPYPNAAQLTAAGTQTNPAAALHRVEGIARQIQVL